MNMIITFILMFVLSNGLTIRSDSSVLYSRLGIIVIFYSLVAAITSFYVTYLDQGIPMYGGLFTITSLTQSIQIFILILCGIILTITGFFPRKKGSNKKESDSLTKLLKGKIVQYTNIINKMAGQFTIIEYALIILFVITGATFFIASADLGSIYICIELQSFSLYILAAMYRNSELGTGASLTYFLLGGLSSCFILLAIATIYSNTGVTNLDGVYSIVSDYIKFINISIWYKHTYLYISFILLSVGFLFKISAAPFHWWSPDVYDGVPTIVTTFLANIAKISILILLVELVHYTNPLLYSSLYLYSWTMSLSISCFFSLIIGTLLGLTQTRIKRLLAYSTISHVGFILLALIANNNESYKAFVFYIIQYIFTNVNAFIIVIAIGFSLYLYFTNSPEYNNLSEKNNSPVQLISQLKGFFTINPILALCLVMVMFSFIGLPPLVGFFGKQMVLTSALYNNNIILIMTGILTSVIGAVYYLSFIKSIYFDESEYKKSYIFVTLPISAMLSIVLTISMLLIVCFILTPVQITNLCEILVAIVVDAKNTIVFDTAAT